MKKLFALLTVCCLAFTSLSAMAEVVTADNALATAENFLSRDSEWQQKGDATLQLVEQDGVPAYYVIEYAQGGWAVVSAQSAAPSVIAYNHTGRYAAPEPMQVMLENRAQKIVEVARVSEELAAKGMMMAPAAQTAVDYPDIAPIISINLNQSEPYNVNCPKIQGQNALVGCVAVGMTQAMSVARYPDRPVGSKTYNCSGVGKLSVDYNSEPSYNWEAVLNCHKTGDYKEVARILYHAGVSVEMMYSLTFSGAYIDDAYNALHRNFQFKKEDLMLVYKSDYSDDKWLQLVIEDMLRGRAVIYIGAMNEAGEGGHCWNIDGWKNSTQMVHVNWGWGGSGDGYFNIDNMTDSYQGISFPCHHAAILGVGGPTTAPYGASLSTHNFVKGTAAGVALANVTVLCDDAEAKLSFELFGPKNITGKNIASPYEVRDGKIVSTVTVEDASKFKYILMKVTNDNTGETFEKEFVINIVEQGQGAVEGILSEGMKVYPSVVESALVIEAPAQGGEYAIYSLSGVQVAAGRVAEYRADVNVSSLPAGTYIVRYMHEQGVGVKTFIKK